MYTRSSHILAGLFPNTYLLICTSDKGYMVTCATVPQSLQLQPALPSDSQPSFSIHTFTNGSLYLNANHFALPEMHAAD